LQNVEGVFGKCNLESVGLEGSSLYDSWLRADERGSFPGGTGIILLTAVDSCTRWILGGLSVGLKQKVTAQKYHVRGLIMCVTSYGGA